MAILFFTKGDKTVASSRQRVWLLAERLGATYGYTYDILFDIRYPFFSLSRRRLQKITEVATKIFMRSPDTLFVHKSLFSWDVIALIVLAKLVLRKKLIYDLDDAEWVHSGVKTRLLVRLADVVFCGSQVIQEWVQKYARRAEFVPTVLDADIYAVYTIRYEPHEPYTIGWTGTGMSHFRDGLFAIVKPALELLSKSGMTFRFVVLGAQGYQPLKEYFKNVPFETIWVDEVNWADPHAVPALMQTYRFDIGLMPQNDTPFNRAKCSFKAIEYMACGIPTIASPVGESRVLIEDGVNGFLTDSTKGWFEKMQMLLTHEDMREAMGKSAQKTIRDRYSYEAILPRVYEVMKNL